MHKQHQQFMEWATAYDNSGLEMRSRLLHEQWLAHLPCPVLRLEGDTTTEAQLATVLSTIAHLPETTASQAPVLRHAQPRSNNHLTT